MGGTADAGTLANALVPVLGSLIAPTTKLIGQINSVGLTGVSAQNGNVMISVTTATQTLESYTTVRTLLLP